jgi:hypothetical protein
MNIAFRLEFITPLFSRGAYEDRPEIRAASIRGQLHWWFRALGGRPADENAIFGSVHGGATASKIVVRVSSVVGTTQRANTLPHKNGDQAGPKAAFSPGTHFELRVLTRLGGLSVPHQSAFDRTLEGWLLLGSLGLRSTRAAGNFRWEPLGNHLMPPADFATYETRCAKLLEKAPLRFALLGQDYATAEAARRVVSDTLGGRDDNIGQDDLFQLRDPLGKIGRGVRKTSPLRFRIVGIGNDFRIIAMWDDRTLVTGNQPGDLAGIIKLLKERKPALGNQLAASDLAR